LEEYFEISEVVDIMVIQSNMTSRAIVEVWSNTIEIFEKYKVPITPKALNSLVKGEELISLISELNQKVGSSNTTCIDGG
jgi:hypothetical protein